MNRREFIRATSALTIATAVSAPLSLEAAELKPANARHLPRWRGFNLLAKFIAEPKGNPPFQEEDFALLTEWGFDFARLPLSYLCWTEPNDWFKLREKELKDIDDAVELGRKHHIHITLNFHRAPGYCCNPPKEPLDLWTDDKALDACAWHWAHFARRYKGVPNDRLSFNLVNEPANVTEKKYVRVAKRLVQEIRAEDPQRLIISDGLDYGRVPVEGLVETGIAQSTHWYDPVQLTFYKSHWVNGSDQWPEPSWPLKPAGRAVVNKEALRRDLLEPWKRLEQKGVGVHVGEFGVDRHTSHATALAWMQDCLELWKEAGWGWCLWNLNGELGVLDSNRADVKYEDFRGHKLDRQMLNLLQSH